MDCGSIHRSAGYVRQRPRNVYQPIVSQQRRKEPKHKDPIETTRTKVNPNESPTYLRLVQLLERGPLQRVLGLGRRGNGLLQQLFLRRFGLGGGEL